jgi:hypothetical protein
VFRVAALPFVLVFEKERSTFTMNTLGIDYPSSEESEEDETSILNRTENSKADITSLLPAEPIGNVDTKAQEQLSRFFQFQAQCKNSFLENFRSKKEFTNPYILEKVVVYFEIDELHSILNQHLCPTREIKSDECVENLIMEQKQVYEERVRQQQHNDTRSYIQFTT